MDDQPLRTLFRLAAVGGAVAVGLTTHDAGFTALTFVGGLMLPRILGIRGHRHGFACAGRMAHGPGGGRGRFEERAAEWHRRAHGESGGEPSTAAAPSA